MTSPDRWSLILVTGAGSASALLYGTYLVTVPPAAALGSLEARGPSIAVYPYLFFPLFALYLLAVVAVLRRRSGPSRLALVLTFAVVFRAALVLSPLVLSDDLYRYVWDGRVQAAGTNPYLHPPSAAPLAALRDEAIWPRINRPESPTIYPPGAEALFGAIHAVTGDSVVGMKAVMALFDLATLGLVVRMLTRMGLRAERVLVYAWSPLVVFELAGSGHAEALMLPFVLAAVLAAMASRQALAGAALGAAALVKLYPAILLPVLYRGGDARLPLAFAATLVLGYLPYAVGAGAGVLGYLPTYLGPREDFNVGIRHLVTAVLAPVVASPRPVAMALLAALIVAAAVYIGRRGAPALPGGLPRRAYLAVGACLLLLPTSLHPWYVVWLVPFLCPYPSPGWLYLTGAVSLSYLEYVVEPRSLYPALWLVEFLPPYALFLARFARRRREEYQGAAGIVVERR